MNCPEQRELRTFLALARGGSFSTAGRELGLSQPAVSLQIAKLEQNVGLPLFHRLPEGARLTGYGRELLPLAEAVEGEFLTLVRRARYWRRSATRKVKMRVAADLLLSAEVGGSCLEVEALEPGEDWAASLAGFETDLVVAGAFHPSGPVPGLACEVVRQESGMMMAWNPAHFATDGAPLRFPEVLDRSLIVAGSGLGLGFRRFVEAWCETAYGRQPLEVTECCSEPDGIEFCKLGFGVLLLPGEAYDRAPLLGEGLRVEPLFFTLLPEALTFGVWMRAREPSSLIRAEATALAARLRG
jgi:DNA-binding transcriptional LysR family regulator